jgi:hypothetical protein
MFDFVVEDDGSGPQLAAGSMADPPTQAEVDAVTTEQLDAAQRSKAVSVSAPAVSGDVAVLMEAMASQVAELQAKLAALGAEMAKRAGEP